MADPNAFQDYGAMALLSALLLAGVGMAKAVLAAMLTQHTRTQATLESMDQHLDVLTVELNRIRRAVERTEVTQSEVPHPGPLTESIPFRRKLPTRE